MGTGAAPHTLGEIRGLLGPHREESLCHNGGSLKRVRIVYRTPFRRSFRFPSTHEARDKDFARDWFVTHHVDSASRSLVVRVRNRACAVPLAHVIETMRPLPIEAIAGMPPFVLGVSIIRGAPTPVVDLGTILGTPGNLAERFVTLRLGERQVALSVSAVLGVWELDASKIHELPPLLQGASREAIEAIGTLDEEMLMVLREGWELPDEVWQALSPQEVAR
jgi:purine-binding chemotaxis protein CheW